jgi:hypothetical protein
MLEPVIVNTRWLVLAGEGDSVSVTVTVGAGPTV